MSSQALPVASGSKRVHPDAPRDGPPPPPALRYDRNLGDTRLPDKQQPQLLPAQQPQSTTDADPAYADLEYAARKVETALFTEAFWLGEIRRPLELFLNRTTL